MPLFRRKRDESPQAAKPAQHAVITHLPLSDDEFGTDEEREAVYELEDRLERRIAAVGGEHDGHEFGGGEAVLYAYGPDADILLETIREGLADFPLQPGAHAIKRYGAAEDPDAREEHVPLT